MEDKFVSKHNFSLEEFKSKIDGMITTNNNEYGLPTVRDYRKHNYTRAEIEAIFTESSTPRALRDLSQNFAQNDGIYSRLIAYYVNFLLYAGLVIPNHSPNANISKKAYEEAYYNAVNWLNRVDVAGLCQRITYGVLVNGVYYGVFANITEKECSVIDLPYQYCRSRFKDLNGNNLIEFNVDYFTTFQESVREQILKSYPKSITNFYKKWMKGKTKDPTTSPVDTNNWFLIPSQEGICMSFVDGGLPPLVDTIIPIMDYDEGIKIEKERALEEINKIIVQEMEHLNDGTLVFEPPEAEQMHRGVVHMMKKNPHVSVMTSYGKVSSIETHSTADSTRNFLSNLLTNIYSKAGVSEALFAPTNGQAIPFSLKNDLSFMMVLATKYSKLFTNLINELFGTKKLSFKYEILPISYYNQSDWVTDTMKLANAGYSLILPSLAMGLTQLDLVNIKELENDHLDLLATLIPLSSSYTQSANGATAAAEQEHNGPAKELEEKSDKTIVNEDSIDNN